MDKATALLHAGRGARGDQESLQFALRAAILGDGIATFAGNPNGNVTPVNRGEWCLDTTNLIFYRASDTTNSGWLTDAKGQNLITELFEDFLGDVVPDEIDTKVGTSALAPAIFVALNGLIRLTTGDTAANTSLAISGVQLQSSLNWEADKGGLSAEFRVKPVTTTQNFAIFVGLTNQTSALQMALTYNDGLATVAGTPTDAVGFFWNPAATTSVNGFWSVAGTKGSTPTAATLLTSAPVGGTFETLRIDVDATGNASFFRNNVKVATVASAITVTQPLTPVITIRKRDGSAVAQTFDLDYWRIRQLR